ncbi:co-chaperone GroES [Candidatus Nesciobacter abundans]|uniref:10 kDa chaperonin n=1 Tax=Candidatus Nesciobacter abundans TaxID=2601668 RepID=A0A5C0UFY0_9PROT|nr:co-chaperone GroES [Candidatus Nesciobacter abundans]QEK39006.1 co-chaperone GroES [Candidatus Nesciobacter abundans]
MSIEVNNIHRIKPIASYIVVKVLEETKTTSRGILLPNSKESPQKGEIISVGPGKKSESGQLKEIDLKQGQVVVFGEYAGTLIAQDESSKYLLIKEEDVYGTYE